MRTLKGITVVLVVALLPFLFAACGSSGTTTATTATTSTPLAAPATLVAEPVPASSDTLTVQWSAVSGASSYHLYYSTTTPVNPASATWIDNAVSPLTLTGLAPGKYYFVVTAVYPEGESGPSEEVGVELIAVASGVPQGVTAFNTAEFTNSITIQWWDVEGAAGYNIYRGTEADLASYYKDPSKAKKIPNALAPYIDTDGIIGGTTYYYVVTSFDSSGAESAPSGEASVKARGSRDTGSGQGGGEDDTGLGNNLSFPVVFADNVGVTGLKITGAWPGVVAPTTPVPAFDFNTGLRPLSTEPLSVFPYFDNNTSVLMGGTRYYPQASVSTWQAEWRTNSSPDSLSVIADWGDALASKTYTTNSVVRIETVLYQDATTGVTDNMAAFNMKLLAGSRDTEMQGTDGTTYASVKRNVFAVNARLIIEKVASDNTVECEAYNNSVWESLAAGESEGGDEGGGGHAGGGAGAGGSGSGSSGGGGGSGAYAGELNVGGSLVYGYNFMINTLNMAQVCNNVSLSKTGTWRIWFKLDDAATIAGEPPIPNHVKIVGKSDATAVIDTVDGKWSYMDISVQ